MRASSMEDERTRRGESSSRAPHARARSSRSSSRGQRGHAGRAGHVNARAVFRVHRLTKSASDRLQLTSASPRADRRKSGASSHADNLELLADARDDEEEAVLHYLTQVRCSGPLPHTRAAAAATDSLTRCARSRSP